MSDRFKTERWSVVEYGDGDSLAIHSDANTRVCFMATHGGSRASWERIQEDAAAIAALPDLYAALEEARTFIVTATADCAEPYVAEKIAHIDAALRLARGEKMEGR